MDAIDVWIKEYDNLWSEKLLHKTTLRKFHNYLTYLTAASTLALTFYGVSTSDVMQYAFGGNATGNIVVHGNDIIRLLCIVFVPIVLITLTFPLNDIFHIYVMARHIAELEIKINSVLQREALLWEHRKSPIYYSGETDDNGDRFLNIIKWGDCMLLIPALLVIGAVAFYVAVSFLWAFGHVWALVYVAVVAYLILTVAFLGYKGEKIRNQPKFKIQQPDSSQAETT